MSTESRESSVLIFRWLHHRCFVRPFVCFSVLVVAVQHLPRGGSHCKDGSCSWQRLRCSSAHPRARLSLRLPSCAAACFSFSFRRTRFILSHPGSFSFHASLCRSAIFSRCFVRLPHPLLPLILVVVVVVLVPSSLAAAPLPLTRPFRPLRVSLSLSAFVLFILLLLLRSLCPFRLSL